MPNIASSIQDYCQKINSRLSWFDIGAMFLVTLTLLGFSCYISVIKRSTSTEVIYSVGEPEVLSSGTFSSNPFASSKGKTYTFSWCRNSGAITEKNKIYFASAEEAEKSGRVLSKFCSE